MSAFTDLETQVQDLSDNFDGYTSDNDQNISSLSDSVSQHDESINALQETDGQLVFPLSQETIDLIKEQFPSGTVTLVAGSATITDPRISTGSVIMLSNAGKGGTIGTLSYAAGVGTATVSSSSNTDTSTIAYLILT